VAVLGRGWVCAELGMMRCFMGKGCVKGVGMEVVSTDGRTTSLDREVRAV
jgi:hypothetical protein